jgi:ABC-type uncharacterized transport system substrate-binding protein
MTHSLRRSIAAALAGLLLACVPAAAHPHVWVTMTSELVYGPDGAVTGVRQAWTFDDMYSAFAIQGVESKEKDKFTRAELAPLAEVNISSLKEFDFFTYAKADGEKVTFADPVDYWLDYKEQMLTLHFTLRFAAPVKAKALDLEVYDPTYFVDFALAEKDPVALAGAPKQCKLTYARPRDASAAQPPQQGEAFFNQNSNYGAQFANKISVKCP